MTTVYYNVNGTIFTDYLMAKEFAEINEYDIETIYDEHPYEKSNCSNEYIERRFQAHMRRLK